MNTRARMARMGFVCLLVLTMSTVPAMALEETGGIGMTVAQLYDNGSQHHMGYIVVLDVFKDGPADIGGIENGDIITHINGQLTKARNLQDILNKEIRGDEGSEVLLRIWRYSLKKRLEIKMTRIPIIY